MCAAAGVVCFCLFFNIFLLTPELLKGRRCCRTCRESSQRCGEPLSVCESRSLDSDCSLRRSLLALMKPGTHTHAHAETHMHACICYVRARTQNKNNLWACMFIFPSWTLLNALAEANWVICDGPALAGALCNKAITITR